MSYWKGLAVAAVIDLVWIMGCPFTVTEPDPIPPVQEVQLSVEPREPDSLSLEALRHVGQLQDSLMMYLQEHPEDVDAMETLADVYADQGWHDAAIGPLARALQLDPSQRSLWVALDRAVEKNGRAKVTDAELVQKAQAFVEAVAMWGMGC